MNGDTQGPIILWINYGVEGWQPKSYDNIKEALEGERYSYDFIITKLAKYTVIDNTDA